jgi:hypothetical protein
MDHRIRIVSCMGDQGGEDDPCWQAAAKVDWKFGIGVLAFCGFGDR